MLKNSTELNEKNAELKKQDSELNKKDQDLQIKNNELKKKATELQSKETELRNKDRTLADMATENNGNKAAMRDLLPSNLIVSVSLLRSDAYNVSPHPPLERHTMYCYCPRRQSVRPLACFDEILQEYNVISMKPSGAYCRHFPFRLFSA